MMSGICFEKRQQRKGKQGQRDGRGRMPTRVEWWQVHGLRGVHFCACLKFFIMLLVWSTREGKAAQPCDTGG